MIFFLIRFTLNFCKWGTFAFVLRQGASSNLSEYAKTLYENVDRLNKIWSEWKELFVITFSTQRNLVNQLRTMLIKNFKYNGEQTFGPSKPLRKQATRKTPKAY